MALIEDRVAKLPPGSRPRRRTPTGTRGWWRSSTPSSAARRRRCASIPTSDGSEAAKLARAIAWHRRPDPGAGERGDATSSSPRARTIPTISTSRGSSCSRAARRRPAAGRLPPGGGAGAEGAARSSAGSGGRCSTWTTTRRRPRRATCWRARSAADKANGARAARPRAGRGAARQRGRGGAGDRRALHARGQLPRRRPQRGAGGGAPARGLAGVAAGAGYHYHGATRAESEGPHASHPLLPCGRPAALPSPSRAQPARAERRGAAAVLALQRRRAGGAARRDPRLPARASRSCCRR